MEKRQLGDVHEVYLVKRGFLRMQTLKLKQSSLCAGYHSRHIAQQVHVVGIAFHILASD